MSKPASYKINYDDVLATSCGLARNHSYCTRPIKRSPVNTPIESPPPRPHLWEALFFSSWWEAELRAGRSRNGRGPLAPLAFDHPPPRAHPWQPPPLPKSGKLIDRGPLPPPATNPVPLHSFPSPRPARVGGSGGGGGKTEAVPG